MNSAHPDAPPREARWPYAHEERVGPGRTLRLQMNGPWLFEGEESFPDLGGVRQRVRIGDFAEFGRGLVLDGQVQLAEGCDALYTTALVFPAALRAAARRDWLIVGGGDGAAAREALRFRDTQAVHLVDISRVVVEQTHKKLEHWNAEGRPGDYHDVVISAVKEVGGPSFFALLVIAVSFLPVLTLEALMRNVLPINTMAIAMGLHVRVGIADDRFTAAVAAAIIAVIAGPQRPLRTLIPSPDSDNIAAINTAAATAQTAMFQRLGMTGLLREG